MKFKKLLVLCLVFFLFLTFFLPAAAEDNEDKRLKELQEKIEEYETTIKELQGREKTLSSTIAYLDGKIQLTTTQMAVTEQELEILSREIEEISAKIDILDFSLNDVSSALQSRVQETYKRSLINPFYLIFSSGGFSDALSRVKYLRSAQAHDRQLLYQLQESKMNYDVQKSLKERKQAKQEALKTQLESQKILLDQQKGAKQDLLEVTKNDEQKFQGLLAAARAEMEAIQSIMAGYGEEIEVGKVNEGQRIASIIAGTSACSTGSHLHFEVVKDGANVNPAGYLQSKGVKWDCWLGDCSQHTGFSGSWSWPMNDPITITQEYGMTSYAKTGAYVGGPHTGYDMFSSDYTVKAVKSGVLSRGSISCGGGTLRYVKVDHADSDIDTYYLHVNY